MMSKRVSKPSGGAWVDAWQVVISIPFAKGLLVDDSSFFAAGDLIRVNGLEYEISRIHDSVHLVLTERPDFSVIGHSIEKWAS